MSDWTVRVPGPAYIPRNASVVEDVCRLWGVNPKDEDKKREPQAPVNRFGEWQALKKGTRQHFGNRTCVFSALDHATLKDIFEDDFKLHEFEFEPRLEDQTRPFVVQSMDLELEEKLNDPDWQRIYVEEYEFRRADVTTPLGPDERGAGVLLRHQDNVEVDAEGMPFIESLAVYSGGVLNQDTHDWKANVR